MGMDNFLPAIYLTSSAIKMLISLCIRFCLSLSLSPFYFIFIVVNAAVAICWIGLSHLFGFNIAHSI